MANYPLADSGSVCEKWSQVLVACRENQTEEGDVTTYDEKVLQQYADDLYQQAKWIVVMSALRYGLAVFLVSFGISMMVANSQKQVSTDSANSGVILVLFLTVLGIAVGVDAGRRKAFMLKLQAQQILCQRQTELNTRK